MQERKAEAVVGPNGTASLHLTLAVCDYEHVSEIAQGLVRFGSAYVPMDETLARAVVDLSGRAYLVYHVKNTRSKIGTFATELAEHFWHSFAEHCKCNLHIEIFYGRNQHHIIEAVFKATARALSQATRLDERIKGVMSTKGSL